MADRKRLVKNTLYMYARMILIMIVSIYTSRVVLVKLGVDDYGLYNAIASIVAMISFLNVTLSTSTSRFLTFDLGRGNLKKLRNTFSTAFYMHISLAVCVLLIMETIGLWYMNNIFIIPEGREFAVHIVFQISILTTIISVVQVPYTAAIMAHENLSVYAYVGIFDVFARLGVVYLLSISSIDHMVFYALLIALIQIIVTSTYLLITRFKYAETQLIWHFSKETFSSMMDFTGWTAVANLSNTMIVQGGIVLLNLFFSPVLVASKALANQISHAVMQFVGNFRVALNPQIIKLYATGEFDEFKKWSLRSAVITVDLLLVIGLPFIVTMKTIMGIWLVEIPPFAVEFAQLSVLSQIISSISSSTYIPFVASGKLKLNAIFGGISGFLYFIILYLIFMNGGGVLWIQWLYLILSLFTAIIYRPYLLHKEIGFTYKEVYMCFWNCLKPIIVSCIISYLLQFFWGNEVWQQIILFILVFSVACVCSLFFFEPILRSYIKTQIINKLLKKI